jgi:predicted LPLAT superfamily acyltransferase
MHWANIEEAGFSGGMRFLFWIRRRAGVTLFRALLHCVMPWFFIGNRVARRASLEYLARLHEASGGATPAPNWRNAYRHFLSFGETIADKLIASDASAACDAPYTAEGVEHLHRLLGEGRGAVIITAHFGNPELCRRLARQRHRNIRLTLLVHTRHAERFNRIAQALDLGWEIEMIQVGGFDAVVAMLLSERIDAGGFVVIAGDRIPLGAGGATLTAPFLGKEAHFPVGPYILAAALGCPVFMMSSARHEKGFAVTVRPLADRIVLPRKAREAAIRPCLDAYVDALANECRKHPLQWFNFYPFWQTPPDEDQGPHDEKSAKSLAS